MGISSSCAPRAAYVTGSNSVKVIDSNGKVQVILYSIKAGELMLENPGQFVCDSTYLHVGCRVRGLNADEELKRPHLYFLLPTDLLFSVLTEEEMKYLSSQAAGATTVKRRRRPKRKLMRSRRDGENLRMCTEEQRKETVKWQGCDGIFGPDRMQRLRSWEPALDTIVEEGIKI